MDILDTKDKRKKNNNRFNGMRQIVFERDNFQCTECGMTQEEHMKKWHKSLTIDHINNIGRTSFKPDNRLENLRTLCLHCHGKKDGPRWMTTVAH